MEQTIEQALQQGISAHKEGKLQEAERLYKAILQAQPAHPDANHNLGVIAASVDKIALALPLFKTALEANPKIEQFWLSYIDALIKENHLETAKVVIEQSRKVGLVGDKVDALKAQLNPITQSALQKHAKDKNANDISPSQSQVDSLLEYYQSGRYTEAKKLAVSITKQFPTYPFGWKILAVIFGQAGKILEVLDVLQKLISLSPQDVEAHSNLGHALKELGRLDEAEASYRHVIALKPDYTEAHNNLGNTLKELGRLEKAEASYRQAIALKPDFAKAYSNLGVTLKLLGRMDGAEASLRQAILLYPDYTEAHNNLGNTLKELGRLEKAEASYRQAIALKPNFAKAHNNLANTLQKLGRLDEAEASYRQSIELKSDYAEAIFNLSVAMNYMNKLDESVLLSKKVLVIDSSNDGLRAAVNLAIFSFLKGDFSESKKLLLKCQKIQEKTSLKFKNEKIYQIFLLKLLSWHESKSSIDIEHILNKKLYVIGESHSLTSHGLHVQSAVMDVLCQSFLIQGCKQSDLGSNIKNQYKNKFEGIFFALPKSSEILLAIGEIDCRLDSGIIKHRNKYPEKNMVELIKTTVENYIGYIFKLNSDTRHNIIIQGVPCPNIDTKDITTEKVLELIDVIREFNVVLKYKSNEVGFGFLDVHKLTDNGNGFSNNIWHIDTNHLSPGAMQKAWSEYGSH